MASCPKCTPSSPAPQPPEYQPDSISACPSLRPEDVLLRHTFTYRFEDPGEVAALEVVGRMLADYVREQGSGTRNAMERFFAEHRFEPRITMEMGSNETIKQAVMAGMGLSFLSLHTIGLELKSGLLAIVPVEGTPVVRTWNIVHLRSRVLSPAAEAFRRFMLEHGQAHLAEHDRPWVATPTPVIAAR